MSDFIPNVGIEQECIARLELIVDIETGGKVPNPERILAFRGWPTHLKRYMVDAKGGASVTHWIVNRLGWYRHGGPYDQLSKQSTRG